MRSYSFPKSERLNGRKEIENLFKQGKDLFKYPFKLIYLKSEERNTPRMLVSVSKRNFKSAVDRNLIKRRIREAYRLDPFRSTEKNYDLAIIYIGKEIVTYPFIKDKLSQLLLRLE